MDQIWPEGQVSRSAFNTALWRTKQFLDQLSGVELAVDPQTLRLTLDAEHALVDAHALHDAAATCLVDRYQPEVGRCLERAVRRWRGPLAEGLTQDWALAARERMHGAYIQALAALMRASAQDDGFELALDFGHRILAEDPFRESVHCEVMWLLALTGQRAHAIKAHARYCALLQDELGIGPMAETEALVDYIRTGLEAMPTGAKRMAQGDPVIQSRTARHYLMYVNAMDRSRRQIFEALQQSAPPP